MSWVEEIENILLSDKVLIIQSKKKGIEDRVKSQSHLITIKLQLFMK